jgi:tetratricopeptide (TPR) repeat protein
VNVDVIPGQDTTVPPPKVLLQAYGGLMASHPEYKAQYNKVLEKAAAEQPNDPVVLFALARAHLLDGTVLGLGQAKNELSRAVRSGSATASAYELYGYALQRSGETGAAIAALKCGLAIYPYATHLYLRLALMHGYSNEFGKALSTIRQELNVFPEDLYARRILQRLENAAGPP